MTEHAEALPAVAPRTLIRIGYWRVGAAEAAPAPGDPVWPDPADFVDPGWDPDERDDLAGYLERGVVVRAYMGLAPCRLCGALNGALELSDGTYLWPSGLPHYVRHHSVRLPTAFVRHAAEHREQLEDAAVDDRWWRTVGRQLRES